MSIEIVENTTEEIVNSEGSAMTSRFSSNYVAKVSADEVTEKFSRKFQHRSKYTGNGKLKSTQGV